MPSLRTIRRRIASTKDIQKITKAMQTVAAVRLRRAQESLLAARPYARKLDNLLRHLSSQVDPQAHPLLAEREVKAGCLVVITADRGLCGSFNANVVRRTTIECRNRSPVPGLVCLGRKGTETLRRRRYLILEDRINFFNTLHFEVAAQIADQIIQMYTTGQVDRVDVLYNEFKSTSQQRIVIEQLLPVIPEAPEEDPFFTGYLYEPDQPALLEALLPRHIRFQVWRMLLESNAAEQAARMIAMDNATRNAGDLIQDLTLTANKVRQASITKELMDIVGGAEALK